MVDLTTKKVISKLALGAEAYTCLFSKDKKTLYVVGRGAAYKIALKTAGFAGRAK
jgi:hypothetical protein